MLVNDFVFFKLIIVFAKTLSVEVKVLQYQHTTMYNSINDIIVIIYLFIYSIQLHR